jgi:CHRD domain
MKHCKNEGNSFVPSFVVSFIQETFMLSRRFFGNALIVAIAAVGLTACESDPQEKYVAELRGSNEVPANNSTALGRVVLLVSRDASYAEYSVEASGLSGGIRGGHFHRAAPGVNGGIVLSFFFFSDGREDRQPIPGTTDLELNKAIARTITKAQLDPILADLRAGNIYANIHTPSFVGGEIRGQMIRQ